MLLRAGADGQNRVRIHGGRSAALAALHMVAGPRRQRDRQHRLWGSTESMPLERKWWWPYLVPYLKGTVVTVIPVPLDLLVCCRMLH